MKDNYFKGLCIIAICIAIVGISIAYSALSQTLKISATGTAQSATKSWNVHFQLKGSSSSCVKAAGYATGGTISVSGTTASITGVILKAPGDSVTCTFQAINTGELTGKLTSYTAPTISYKAGSASPTSTGNVTYSITYGGKALTAGGDFSSFSTLTTNTAVDVVVTLTYSSSAALPSADTTVSLTNATLGFTQA